MPKTRLIAPEDGELDLEARQRTWAVIGEFTDNVSDFIEDSEATDVEEALYSAEQRGLDDEVRALELILDMVEMRTGIEEDDLEGRASAIRESADELRDRLAEDPSAYGNMLDGLAETVIPDARLMRILSSAESWVAFTLVGYLNRQNNRFASALRQHLSLTDSADEAIDAVSAILEAAESVANLLTGEGEQKFQGRSLRELIERSKHALAREIARIALSAVREDTADSDSMDSAEVLNLAREFAKPFDEDLDFDPVWEVVEIELYEETAKTSESELRASLNEGDLERASVAMDDYIRISQSLGSLYARQDRSKLIGENAEEHAKLAGQNLFGRGQAPVHSSSGDVSRDRVARLRRGDAGGTRAPAA